MSDIRAKRLDKSIRIEARRIAERQKKMRTGEHLSNTITKKLIVADRRNAIFASTDSSINAASARKRVGNLRSLQSDVDQDVRANHLDIQTTKSRVRNLVIDLDQNKHNNEIWLAQEKHSIKTSLRRKNEDPRNKQLQIKTAEKNSNSRLIIQRVETELAANKRAQTFVTRSSKLLFGT